MCRRFLFRLRKRLFVRSVRTDCSTRVGGPQRDQFESRYTEQCLLFHGPDLSAVFSRHQDEYPYLTQAYVSQLAFDGSRIDDRLGIRDSECATADEARTKAPQLALMFGLPKLRGRRGHWFAMAILPTSASCSE